MLKRLKISPIILLTSFFILLSSRAFAITPPSFSISPSSGTFYLECDDIDSDILIHTNNTNTDSANIIINYDPTKLEVIDAVQGQDGVQISTGSAYDNYAGNTVDTNSGIIRLTGYNINSPYNSGDNFGTFGNIDFNIIGEDNSADLTFDFTLGETIDSNIAETGTSQDILNDVETASFNVLSDVISPSKSSLNPTASETEVAINSNVVLSLSDVGCGLNMSSVTITVDGTDYTSASPQLSYINNSGTYQITINPSANFEYNDTINVSISANDTTGNNLYTDSYSFDTIVDLDDPYVDQRDPSASGTNIAINDNVDFHINDDISGVDLSTLSVTIDGTQYTNASQQMSVSGTSADYLISINPSMNFAYNDTIQVSISGDDYAGNTYSGSYSFDTVVDTDPPYVENETPSSEAAVNSNIVFDIKDLISGVDLSELVVTVTQQGTQSSTVYRNSVSPTFSNQSISNGYRITINPSSDFQYNDTIEVDITAKDNADNSYSGSYNFDTLTDTTGPTISPNDPEADDTGVAINNNIVIDITDSVSGVDLSSAQVTVTVDGSPTIYTYSGQNTFSSSSITNGFRLTINPSSNFPYNTSIPVSVEVDDHAENSASLDYSFTTFNDNIAPAVTNRNPAPSSQDISIDTNISFTISDANSGVDLNTLSVTVEGTTYTSTGQNQFQYTGNESSYNITINPASNFNRSEVVSISIDAEDFENNAMTTIEYDFTIIDNLPPVLDTLSNRTVAPNEMIAFIVSGNDQDGDGISFSFNGATLPASAQLVSVSSTSSIFSWLPTEDYIGSHSVTFTVTDDAANPASDSQEITIEVTGTPPSDTLPPQVSNKSPASGATDVSATSNISFTITDNNSGVDLDSLSVVVNSVTYTKDGDNTFSYSGTSTNYSITIDPDDAFLSSTQISASIDASDITGNAMTTVNYSFTTAGNQPPVLSTLTDKTVQAGDSIIFLVSATDPDGDDLTFSISGDSLPDSATFISGDSDSKIFSWETTDADIGQYDLTFEVEDTFSNSDSQQITITVNEVSTSNSAPVLIPLENKIIARDRTLSFLAIATDANDDNMTFTLESDTLQDCIEQTDVQNGIILIKCTPDNSYRGEHQLKITVTDDGSPNLSDEQTITVTVENKPCSSSRYCPPAPVCTECETCAEPVVCEEPAVCEPEIIIQESTVVEECNDTVEILSESDDCSDLIEELTNTKKLLQECSSEEKVLDEKELKIESILSLPLCQEPEKIYIPVNTTCPGNISTTKAQPQSKNIIVDNDKNELPLIINIYPAPNSKDIATNSIISFDVSDDRGVKIDSTELEINGKKIKNITLTGTPRFYHVKYIPEVQLPANSEIKLIVKLKDLVGKQELPVIHKWKFKTGAAGMHASSEEDEYEKCKYYTPEMIIDDELFMKNVRVDYIGNDPVVLGSTNPHNRVFVTWMGRNERVTVEQAPPGGYFRIKSPIDYKPGYYSVEVYATNGLMTKMTKTVTLNFKISNFDLNLITGSSFWGCSFPWWIIILIIFIELIRYWFARERKKENEELLNQANNKAGHPNQKKP